MTHEYIASNKKCDDHGQCCNINCLSLKAIFIGALVAVGLSFLLNLFIVGLGLSAYTPSKTGILTLAIGGFFAMAIGIMVVMFFAGWVSGYLGRAHCANRHFGVLYGLSTWCLAMVVSAILIGYFGDFVNRQHNTYINANEIVLKMASGTSTSKSSEPTATNTRSDSTQGTSRQDKEHATNTMGKSLLLTFLLFFVGAVTCSYGGYVGMGNRLLDKK